MLEQKEECSCGSFIMMAHAFRTKSLQLPHCVLRVLLAGRVRHRAVALRAPPWPKRSIWMEMEAPAPAIRAEKVKDPGLAVWELAGGGGGLEDGQSTTDGQGLHGDRQRRWRWMAGGKERGVRP